MSHRTPPPGVNGYSQDPLQEYSHEDGYREWRRANRFARQEANARRAAVDAEREAKLQAELKRFDPAPEYVYALAFGLIVLGFGIFAVNIGVPLDYSLFPVGVGGMLTLCAAGTIIYEHWKKQ